MRPFYRLRSELRELSACEVEDSGPGKLVGKESFERLMRRVLVRVVVALGDVAERGDPCML